MDLTALYQLTYGMYVVGAVDGERPVGCFINTCMQITAEPAVVAISVNKENYTHGIIEKTGRFSLSVLSEKSPPAVISVFGFRSSANYDKFTVTPYEWVEGLPVIRKDTCAIYTCTLVNQTDLGTHTVFFGRVETAENGEKLPPMTYEYYHRVIKGKAPAKAPTYIDPAKENKAMDGENNYVCTVCGYVHKGSIDNEPSDYVCPVCGVPKSKFKPQ